ncbi:IS701 family transposase [Streptosporangium sp. NBC_01495]|uniref:IS701 family transposase n=1 Tax=Streptosporangium sp. NBC_01495 TaxID=2903899 RepID=UPI003FCCD3E7
MTLCLTYDHVVSWDAELSALTARIADPLFKRPEPKAVFSDLVRGLLADVPRKNSWQLSDHLGHPTSNRIEHLLSRAQWDADLLRDAVRGYVVEHLGRPDGVLIADDTAAIKKGDRSAGVARQYCGLTGQIENCQVMPMLTYASTAGHAFINRRLYLPEAWAGDLGRRRVAGVPEQVVFATKPQQVIDMLGEEIAAATPFRYFTADSGYGRDPGLRVFCHAERVAYVMAVPVDLPLLAARGGAEPVGHVLDRLLAMGNNSVWERRSCGAGVKGMRLYDWAAVAIALAEQQPADGYAHTLLIRRSISDPGEVEFFLAHARTATPLPELISVAGMRWKVEENNETGKDLLGLTEYQVRRWDGWHRHVTTVMLALAFLAVTHAHLDDEPADPAGKAHPLRERAH